MRVGRVRPADRSDRCGDVTRVIEVKAFGEQMIQIAEKIGPGRTVGDLPVGTLTLNDLALMRATFELKEAAISKTNSQ